MALNMNSLNTTRFEGLQYIVYDGYMNDNVNFFSTAPLYTSSTTGPNQGLILNIPSLDIGTNNCLETNGGATTVSVEWLGYFKSNYTGTWTFYLNSDDCSYLWVGPNALSGRYTANNTVVDYPNTHGMINEQSGTINLNASTYYPIRIQLGQKQQGLGITIAISNPTLTKTYTPLGYFYFFNNGVLNP
jgi:hypothetical protein